MFEAPTYQYAAIVNRIVDADTIDVTVDCGFRIYTTIRCRLYRINAPERFTVAGKAATAFLTDLLNQDLIIIKTYKEPTDKYGRWVADVFVDGVNVSQIMVDNGHAVWVDY